MVKRKKNIVLATVSLLLLHIFLLSVNLEHSSDLLLPAIDPALAAMLTEAMDALPDDEVTDVCGTLTIEGYNAPFDASAKTYYVPQSADRPEALDGMLSWSNPCAKIYLVTDDGSFDKRAAILSGTVSRLLICIGKEYFYRNIVFTGLPAITISPDTKRTMLYNDEASTGGLVCIFDPAGAPDGGYIVTSSGMRYELRGNYSKGLDKPQYKISFLSGNGKKSYENVLSLPRTDAILLSAQMMEQSKIRGCVSQTLWNELCEQSPGRGDFKTCNYVFAECFDSDGYLGLYGVMEHFPECESALNAGDIFAKAYGRCSFCIVDSTAPGLPGSDLYRFTAYQGLYRDLHDYVDLFGANAESASLSEQIRALSMENCIDFSLYTELICGIDNMYTNFFLYAPATSNRIFRFYKIPWDCDRSFGHPFGDIIDTDMSLVTAHAISPELYTLMKKDPSISDILNERWAELRKSVFSEENVLKIINDNFTRITDSGAMARDSRRWPECPNITSCETLIEFTRQRIAHLDARYSLS